MAYKGQKLVKAVTQWSLTMVPTCKNVAPYSPTPLNVGTMVNAPLCDSLFLSFLCHPYILTIIVVNFYCLVSAPFMEHELRCTICVAILTSLRS